MNFIHYLNTVARLWNCDDGSGVSKFLSLNGNHVKNRNIFVEDAEPLIIRHIKAPLDEVLNAHLKVVLCIRESRKLSDIIKTEFKTIFL